MQRPTEWFDTHCHLDSLEASLAEAIERASAAGVNSMVTVGTNLATSRRAIEIAQRYQGVWAAVGVHPHESENFDEKALEEVVALAGHPKVVAIGEIGLDYYREFSERHIQQRAFKPQLEAARSLGKPVILHARESYSDVFDAVEQTGELSVVFHCFSGSPGEAARALDLGGYISFAGNISFRNSTSLQQAAAGIPHDRLLVETDSPYLAPMPHRGKTNEPGLVPLVGEALAAATGMSVAQTALNTSQNARAVFQLK